MGIRTLCKNRRGNSLANYTGTEPSPKGRGYCARFEQIGTKMKGKDGNIWVVQTKSNGVRAWFKTSSVKTSSVKTVTGKIINTISKSDWKMLQRNTSQSDQRDIHIKLLNLGKVFTQNGINVIYSIWTKYSDQNFFDANLPWDILHENDRSYHNKPYILISFKIAKLDYVCLQHTLDKKWKPIVDQIMFKEFKHLYQWDGKANNAICIRV
jgi:hypothetical protein